MLKDSLINFSFKDSKIPTYSRMWVFMDSDDTNFVGSNKEGIGKKLSCMPKKIWAVHYTMSLVIGIVFDLLCYRAISNLFEIPHFSEFK